MALYRLCIGVFLMHALSFGAAPEQVQLSNDKWTVAISPQSLEVLAHPKGKPAVPISKGQTGLGNVTALIQHDNRASWALPETALTVNVALSDELLSIEFLSATSGDVTWPIIPDTPYLRGYILPFFEGSYVPKTDKLWQDFLSEQGPISTTAGLSMPFWGVDFGEWTLTYILTNPFNNRLSFESNLGMQVSHAFTPNWERKGYGVRVTLGEASPVAPAKHYRHWLMQNSEFVTFAEKVAKLPAAEKLLGAAHIYLWGGTLLSRYDITERQAFATKLSSGENAVTKDIWEQLNPEAQQAVRDNLPHAYAQGIVCRALSELLEARETTSRLQAFAQEEVTFLPAEAEKLLARDVASLSLSEVYRLNSLLFYAAFSDELRHPDEWGDGLSVKLLERFAENGLDRLWLGVDSWKEGFRHPAAVEKAKELGYLIGPYDSYHSIHHPQAQETWETAQFDLALYERGAVVNADGTKNRGFQQKGYHLSPLVAQPYVEKRVNDIAAQMPTQFNSWFIDCDAYGELFDDYSTEHPATQFNDMQARLERIAWIRDTHQKVVGSEGGAAYAAATLHFAHGMMTPVIGWGDADMEAKDSPYYIGGYWPPEAPAIFVKQVPLKPRYLHLYFDPGFRLPLYQIVFHDSLMTTNHWLSSSLKFREAEDNLALLELLYNVPPLYHLNVAEFDKHAERIKKHYAFFSPLHRKIGGKTMTDFEWLSPDRLVQRTAFSDAVELFANFGTDSFAHEDLVIPARSVVAKLGDTIQIFSSQVFSGKNRTDAKAILPAR